MQPPKVIAASLLPVAASLALAAHRREQPLALPFELDMSRRPPAFVELYGFSGAEPWGRWTDGAMARVRLPRRLPGCVSLELDAKAFGPNVGESLRIEAGEAVRELVLGAELETRTVMLCGLARARELRLRVPRPTSPRALGLGEDGRQLGIGIARLALRELPLAVSERQP